MIDFGRDICGDPVAAAQREWLVTNGIGGYASGTISGELTRRYQGLLVAALNPPPGRTLLVSKLNATARYDGQAYPLTTNGWSAGDINPRGYLNLERFRLEGSIPVWTYACGDALLEKRIWMEQHLNTVYVRFRMLRGSCPLTLEIEPLVNYRGSHEITNAQEWTVSLEMLDDGLKVHTLDGAVPFSMSMTGALCHSTQEWHRDLFLSVDDGRGIAPHEDHLQAGRFEVTLEPGRETTFIASTEKATATALESHDRRVQRDRALIEGSALQDEPQPIQQLVLAADQFIVQRPFAGDPDGRSVIAGYHWFEDWGRDTMISLPGLTLVTGRPEVARRILLTYAAAASKGMLPNRFPEDGSAPVYNTIDATPWFFEAARAYYASSGDCQLVEQIFPTLIDMIDWHERGTRYGIRFNPQDGLVGASSEGAPLTWMDARMGDFVPTPRIGKPVEISALWYNALCSMIDFAQLLGQSADRYEALAARLHHGFQRFWNDERDYCYDVLDGPDGDSDQLRPNQLLAVSLPHSPLEEWQQRAIVDSCARALVTSHGLRSLAPSDDAYLGQYSGGLRQRDAAYHQGTVWAWLIGPFASAHLRVYGDRTVTRSYLEPLFVHLRGYGLGTISEIFDADPPFQARGCIAQAWSVAEVLRVWKETMD